MNACFDYTPILWIGNLTKTYLKKKQQINKISIYGQVRLEWFVQILIMHLNWILRKITQNQITAACMVFTPFQQCA